MPDLKDMTKAQLIKIIEQGIEPNSASQPAPVDDPIALIMESLKINRKSLKDARERLYKETTETGIESAKNAIRAAENRVRLIKEKMKRTRRDQKENVPFSWSALLGIIALVVTAAGTGVGVAMLLDNGSEAIAVGNGDNL